MPTKIPKKKIPKIIQYITEVRKYLKQTIDKTDNIYRQMVQETEIKLYNIEHILFILSIALEDLRKIKQELKLKIERKTYTTN